MVNTSTAFSRELRAAREKANLSLRELSSSCGLSPTYLHRLERGHELKPSAGAVERLSAVFNWDLLEMLMLIGSVQSIIDRRPDIERLLTAAIKLGPETVVKWAMGLEANSTCEDCG